MENPRAGDTFGRYAILGELGRGGMGVVLRARQLDLEREVALKVLATELADQEEFATRFRREASLLASVDSPHIIAVYDHGEHDGRLFIATQLVKGGDLAHHLRQHGPLTLDEGLDLAAQLASALADAHAAGVLHRDVKPNNVLLRETQDGRHAYLCDFGIAHTGAAGLTQAGTVVGTYGYLAPERCEGQPATVESDIYALGCLLVAALAGNAPYSGSDFQVAQQHLTAPIPQWDPTFPGAAELNEILRVAMAKSPGDRYHSATDLRRDLLGARESARIPQPPATPTVARPAMATPAPDRTVLRPTPPATAGSSPTPPPARPGQRSTAAVVLGTVLAVVLVGALAVGGYLTFRPDAHATTATRPTPPVAGSATSSPTGAAGSSPSPTPAASPTRAAAPTTSTTNVSTFARHDLACSDGGYVVVLGSTFNSSTPASTYDATLREFDSQEHPASYAMTRDSCPNLGAIEGAGVGSEIPYLGPFTDAVSACQTRLDAGTTSTYIAEVDGGTAKVNCACAFDDADLPQLGPGTSTDNATRMWVTELQAMLEKAGIQHEGTTGNYLEKTTGWVRDLQRRHGLPETGSMDADTWDWLKRDSCP